MKAARVEIPGRALELYEKCRRELGISRRLPLWVVDAAISPGIAFFGRPVLLLPASMLDADEALRFALMHELTHQKRGDHAVSALMNLLRMIHWFNPIVHFAFSQMQSDMETACDFDVMRSLRPDEKRAYLTAIIDLFSFEAQPQLGMGGFRTRSMAQRRLKAFMRKTSAIGAKISAALLAALLLSACFTTACRKAPEEAFSGGTARIENVGSNTDAAMPAPGEERLRSSYTLVCGSWGVADDNIRHAAEKINANGGIRVQPGEEWSFTAALGPFTEDNGWTFVPGVDDGEAAEDAGMSGICCVSAALYCALLSGGIEISERSAHAWPFAYVPAGLDAAVSTGGSDLKFVNNTSRPLTIKCAVADANTMELSLAVELWGKPLPENTSFALRSVTVEYVPSVVRYVGDPTLPQGMERWISSAHEGRKVEVYRDALNSGASESTELLYTDEYRAVTGVTARGTKVPVPLSDRSKAELSALAKLYQSKYKYDSGAPDFEEINLHYGKFFEELEVDFGGIMSGGGDTGLTVGIPMQEFDLNKCYPYAAVLFALDPALKGLSIGSLKYDPDGPETVHLERADVESYYSSVLDRPLLDYAKSEKLLAEMMIATAGYR